MNKTDEAFVEAVRQFRLDIPKPVAWISGKVIHQFKDLSDGYEPLYKQHCSCKVLTRAKEKPSNRPGANS